ncbi:C4-dicarboxylate transporter DcuC [Oleiharenicola lentus]|uniref:C4-dicarboxylate transporter DcuC n=1 Tax=Oleiharenicola lentus TaxID=2508720 RepID=UPI003F66F688
MLLTVAFLIIGFAAYLLVRQVDVRLVLFGAGLLLALLAGKPLGVFDAFIAEMGNGKTIGPICSAMGYSFVLRATGCDRAMVSRLMAPLRRAGWLLLPGGCVVAFFTNVAINSQTAAAAAVGPILVPLLIAAGFPAVVAAATLLLGTSCGNLCNPGEADLVAIHDANGAPMAQILSFILPPVLGGFAVLVTVFTVLNARSRSAAAIPTTHEASSATTLISEPLWKAFMPPLPVVMIFVMLPGFIFDNLPAPFERGLPVPYAMLVSTIVVLLASWRGVSAIVKSFFEGMGQAYAQIISLIVTASCFIAGITAVGLTEKLVNFAATSGFAAKIAASVFPGLLAVVCGSGTGPSVAFSKAVLPALRGDQLAHGIDLGVLGAIAANYGRTLSPVAAVVIFTCTLAGVAVPVVIRKMVVPLAVGFAVAFGIVALRGI